MPVIPFPQTRRHSEPAPVLPPNRESRIQGTFTSPSGRVGTMTGCLRLDRFVVVSGRLCAAGVFAGQLLDADGTTIGWGSRRKIAPAKIVRGPRGVTAVIGPVDVDLLGLTMSVPAFTIDSEARMRRSSRPLPLAWRRSRREPQMRTGA
jgi:hypothetical protein